MYEIFARLLQKRGITPYRVHKDTGIAQSTFSDWKNGKSIPGTEKMKIIADYFGVTVDYLLTGEHKEKAPILTTKEERDVERKADELLAGLSSDSGLMLAGMPLSDEAKELFRNSVIDGIRDAKLINKVKYNPHKNKKKGE